jgi:hypothetical protein
MNFLLEVLDPTALDLFEKCEKCLERFGEVELTNRIEGSSSLSSPDGYLTITAPNGTTTRYVCEAKRRIDLNALAPVAARLQEWSSKALKPLLITEHVNDSLADRLQGSGIDYLDAAGNAFLVADPHVYIWLRGFKPLKRSQRVSRAFQTTGLQLIALLLSRPNEIVRTYREIAHKAGLSLGSTSRILSDLRSLGFIQLVASGQNSLINRRSLLEHWELGYATRLRPRLKPQAFRQAEKLPVEELHERIPKPMRDEILVGGELAAALATRHLRPQAATFHVRPHRPLLPLIKEMRLIPDRDGNIVLLEQFGEMSAWGWEGQEKKHLANPLLVYAELLQRMPDDRLRETANLILNEYLAPIFDETASIRG